MRANFGEIQRAQLAKSTLLTSSLVPLGPLQIFFKVCSEAKERVGCGNQREATAPIKSIVKMQPWFLSLRWKTCLRQNCILGFSACSEGSDFGQNTNDDDDPICVCRSPCLCLCLSLSLSLSLSLCVYVCKILIPPIPKTD